MKLALAFLLLALIVIPSADCWRRRRRRWFRFRVPRIRKIVKKVFRPVVKVVKKIKPVVKLITKPVKAVVKPVLKKVEKTAVKAVKKIEEKAKKIVKPIVKKLEDEVKKVVKPVLKTAEKLLKPIVKPLLKPLQKKICGQDEPEPNEQPEPEVEYEYEYVTAEPTRKAERDAEGMNAADDTTDDIVLRGEDEIEEKLEMFARQGRALEALNEIVRDDRDVREIYKILEHPLRSRGLKEKIGKALCGGGGEEEQQEEQEGEEGPPQEEIVEVPVTVVEYVTAPVPTAA